MRLFLLCFLLLVWLAVVTTACSGGTAPIATPGPPAATSTATPSPVPTPTPAAYERSLVLFDYDAQEPLDVDETSASVRDGVTVHDISYASPNGGRAPAFLIVPDGAGPFAGVIVQHGMPAYRDSHLGYAMVLAKTGAVVLLVDAPFARRMRADADAQPFTFTEDDRDEQVQLIVDLRRGVDLLTSREDVDADRLGFIGFSHGAAMGGLLAGVESRIGAYVLAVGAGGLISFHQEETSPIGRLFFLPQERQDQWLDWMEEIEPILFVGQAAPAALFFQNGLRDRAIDEEAAVRYQEAGSEPKRVEWYDSGHNLTLVAILDQVEWLGSLIGIDAERFEVPEQPSGPPSPERFVHAFQSLALLVRTSGSTELQERFLELVGSAVWPAPPLPQGVTDQMTVVAGASGQAQVRDRLRELMDAPRHSRAVQLLELTALIEASGHPALEVIHQRVIASMLFGRPPTETAAERFVAVAESLGNEEILAALEETGLGSASGR